MRCEPASSLIEKLGGLRAVADLLNKQHTTVLRWRQPKEKGGTGGVVPHWHHEALRAEARRRGIELTLADFVPVEQALVDA